MQRRDVADVHDASKPVRIRVPLGTPLRVLSPLLAPKPRDRMIDQQGRPYFLWDVEMTLDEFERSLHDADPAARSYLVGKLMRQAKPDDVLQFVSPQQLADLWPSVGRYLGKSRAFWTWLLESWELWIHPAVSSTSFRSACSTRSLRFGRRSSSAAAVLWPAFILRTGRHATSKRG